VLYLSAACGSRIGCCGGGAMRRGKREVAVAVTALVLLAVVAAVLSLVRHKGQGKDYGTPSPAERASIRIGVAMQPPSALAIIAHEEGLFSRAGVDATVVEYPSGKRALLEGLLPGEVDLVTTAAVPVVFGSFDRSDSRIVAAICSMDTDARVVARKDKGIAAPADLRGKRIATQRGSAVHFFLHLFLIKNGLSERDVEVSFMKAEELAPALSAGEIDAFSMREPYVSDATELLGDNAIVMAEPGLYFRTELLVALGSFIEQHPETMERALLAMLQAEEFAEANREKAIDLVARKLGADRDVIAALWGRMYLRVSLDQSVLLSLEDIARWTVGSGFVSLDTVPNYMEFLYLPALERAKPEAVTVIR